MRFNAVITYYDLQFFFFKRKKEIIVNPQNKRNNVKKELSNLVTQVYILLQSIKLNNRFKADMTIEFFFENKSFLKTYTRTKAIALKDNQELYVDDFFQKPIHIDLNKSDCLNIQEKVLSLYNNWSGYLNPTMFLLLKSELEEVKKDHKLNVSDRRTVLYTNSYVTRSYDEIKSNITKLPSAIVYNRNGKK
jgi:hypothetical protein